MLIGGVAGLLITDRDGAAMATAAALFGFGRRPRPRRVRA